MGKEGNGGAEYEVTEEVRSFDEDTAEPDSNISSGFADSLAVEPASFEPLPPLETQNQAFEAEVTQRPVFEDLSLEPRAEAELDPWTEVTPADKDEGHEVDESWMVKPADPMEEASLEDLQSDVVHDDWKEQSDAKDPAIRETELRDYVPSPEPEDAYDGDGPFAAPLDEPTKDPAAFVEPAPAEPMRFSSMRAPPPPLPSQSQLMAPLVISRKEKRKPKSSAQQPPRGAPKRPSAPSLPAEPVRTERKYPKMLALLQNPEGVPLGSDPIPEPQPPPVPGTFFPAPKEPLEEPPEAADLDQMLATMADGLLLGGTDDEKEIRVTLRDEFFAGTELRIAAGGGEVRVILVPPDRDTYLSLNGNIEELRERLSSRGFRVGQVQVVEP